MVMCRSSRCRSLWSGNRRVRRSRLVVTSLGHRPNPKAPGVYTFDVVVSDGVDTDTETITVTVAEVNVAPTAVDDTATTQEDTTVTIPVLANDTDVETDPLTVTFVTTPFNGSATLNTDGTITYNPDPDFFGVDTFGYAISDSNGGVDSATVTITVTPVNDAPVAVDDTASTPEDTGVVVAILDNDFDVDGTLDPATVSIAIAPTNGGTTVGTDGSIVYVPVPDFNGVDTFVYQVCDDGGACSVATVTVTVGPANDAPVLGAVGPRSISEMIRQSFIVTASDADGNPLLFSLSDGVAGLVPAGASIDPTTGEFSWTPTEAQGPGVYTFDIVVADDGSPALSDAETIIVTVGEVNAPPVADGIPFQSVVGGETVLVSPSASDSDVPAQSLVWRVVMGPGTVLLDGRYHWVTRAGDGPGIYTVTLEVSDGLATDTVSFDVNVDESFSPLPDPPENRAPIAVTDDVVLPEDGGVDIAPLAN